MNATHIIRMPTRRLATLVLCVLAFTPILLSSCSSDPPPGFEQADLKLTWENIFRQGGGASHAEISPAGDHIVLVHSGKVFVMSAEGVDGGVHSAGVSGHSPTWSPDGTRIAWIDGERLWIGAFEPALDSTSAPAITNPESLSTALPGIRSPSWSPSGQAIAVFAARYGPEGHQDIYLVETDTSGNEPATTQLTSSAAVGDDGRFRPQWSPDSKWIAFISNQSDWWHDDVWLVNTANSEAHQVSTDFMASSSPVWSPTSTNAKASLVAMGTAKDGYWYQDLADLYRVDLDLSGDKPVVVAENKIPMQVYATDFIMRFDPYFSANGDTVYFPYHERGAFDLWAISIDGGVATRATNVGGAWSTLHADTSGDRAVFVRDAATEGREVWLFESQGGPARKVTDVAPHFTDVQIPLEVSLPTFDGLYLQGFLYLPPALLGASEDEVLSCPALVQVHGGGTNSYYQGTNLTEQVLAARGFPVLAINYRGGSGFGREFQDLSVEDWLNDQSKDPGAAADWLRTQPWSNGKVGIYGGSYGGMQSMSAITRTPDKFDAAVPMRGIYSEALTLPFADRLGKIFTITGHGGTPEERPDTYAKSETLDRMDQITAPVLVMHGDRDVRAPFRNFELAVEQLEALGKQYESKTYPEGHAFRDPDNLIDMYSRLEGFFRQHLGECQ